MSYSEFTSSLKLTFATFGVFIGAATKNIAYPLYALLALMVIDYITGVINAAVKGEVNSSIGYDGIAYKAMMIFIVCMAAIIDAILSANSVITIATIMFYIANEGISIIENASEIGLPIPQKIRDTLLVLKDEGDKDEDNS